MSGCFPWVLLKGGLAHCPAGAWPTPWLRGLAAARVSPSRRWRCGRRARRRRARAGCPLLQRRQRPRRRQVSGAGRRRSWLAAAFCQLGTWKRLTVRSVFCRALQPRNAASLTAPARLPQPQRRPLQRGSAAAAAAAAAAGPRGPHRLQPKGAGESAFGTAACAPLQAAWAMALVAPSAAGPLIKWPGPAAWASHAACPTNAFAKVLLQPAPPASASPSPARCTRHRPLPRTTCANTLCR